MSDSTTKDQLVEGIGINDANYFVAPRVNGSRTVCPFYQRWHDMLKRCYSLKCQTDCPTYAGCKVIVGWHSFTAFKAWMMQQDWKNKHLDKGIHKR